MIYDDTIEAMEIRAYSIRTDAIQMRKYCFNIFFLIELNNSFHSNLDWDK